jgi:hypothetical protein
MDLIGPSSNLLSRAHRGVISAISSSLVFEQRDINKKVPQQRRAKKR